MALLMVVVIVLVIALREHYAHVLGFAPYLLLLACPLIHLFHGHGHQDRTGRPPSTDPPADGQP